MTNKEEQDLPHVIVSGNPGGGFKLEGPFKNWHEAHDRFSDIAGFGDETYWIMPVYPIEETEESPDTPHDSYCAKRMHGAAECTCSKS
jgi:hypothetical protein